MSSSALDDATLDRLRAVFEAAGGDAPVVLTDAAGRAVLTLAGPPAAAEVVPAADTDERDPDPALLRLADYIDSLPEDPYAEFRTDESTSQILRQIAVNPGRETTGTQILAEAARRERDGRGGSESGGGAG